MQSKYSRGASVAVAIIAGTRFWAYSPLSGGPHEAPAILALTDGGRYLPLFSMVWLALALWALWDGFVKDTGWSEAILLATMAVWGGSYGIEWLASGLRTTDWMAASLYIGFAMYVLFRYLERMRQDNLLRLNLEKTTLITTGSLPIHIHGALDSREKGEGEM